MNLNAILDLDVIALESEDRISVLLELTAPEAPADRTRPPGTLQIVLDRSGSMGHGRLDAAGDAIDSLLARLDPTDNFGLVTFDSGVQVAVPAGPLTNKEAVRQLVRALHPGSMTNLSGGLLRGMQEARRVKGDAGATLVLLSDGHANEGIVEHDRLQSIAAAAQGRGVLTSTIGIGLGYDELLMDALARGGGGNSHFAEQGDDAGAAIASEVDHLLDQAIQAASLAVRPTWDVETVSLFNDLPAAPIDGGFMVELGDFYSGEQRKLLLTIDVPAMTGLGAVTVCELELSYVSVGELKSETITIPVNVNVVPGRRRRGAGAERHRAQRAGLPAGAAHEARGRRAPARRRHAERLAPVQGSRPAPRRGIRRRTARRARGDRARGATLGGPRRAGAARGLEPRRQVLGRRPPHEAPQARPPPALGRLSTKPESRGVSDSAW